MIKRQLQKWLTKSASLYPIVSITGPRQSGKTTVVKKVFPKFQYVSLEDPDNLDFATNDPKGFFKTYNNKVILDEIQQAPLLFSYLQSIVDASNETGRFILSGSQQFLLNEKISQTLAGRTALCRLLPLSLSELMARTPQSVWFNNKNKPVKQIKKPNINLYSVLINGMYPRIYDKKIPANKFYRDYIATYVTKDVRTLLNIGNLNKFQTFLRLIAARCGQRVNLTSLGDDTGIDHTTVKKWLSVLEASYIIHLLPPHFKNFNKTLVKSPKIYFLDTGLLCYLLRIKNIKELQYHSLIGGIFESFVFSELYKTFAHADEEAPIYFWQDKSKKEIDFLIDIGTNILPIEVKSSQTINTAFFKNLNYWLNLKDNPEKSGFLIYAGDEWQQRTNNTAMPWYAVS